MKSEAQIKKYIFDWLSKLGLGPVFQDRKPIDDTTKTRAERTYVVFDFPNGIEDEGPWWRGQCIVCVGCRDKKRFVADLETLDRACQKLRAQFEKDGRTDTYQDDVKGISFIDFEFVDDYQYGADDHEYQYTFDVFAQKL